MRLDVVLVSLAVAIPLAAQVPLSGLVLSSTKTPVSGARVILRGSDDRSRQTFTEAEGRFRIELPASGSYSVTIERAGFYPVRGEIVEVEPGGPAEEFILEPVREIVESINVGATPLAIDMDTSTPKQTMSGAEIQNIPYPNTNDFRSALRILPGVVRDNKGGLHINGASEEQTLYTLNGFTLNDPLTGRFETRLSVESVQAVEIANGVLPAEFGKGSAGALSVQSNTGADKIRYGATNFFPGFENRKGWTIGDWAPRASISGPIRRGRAWFSDTLDFQYMKTFIRELPKGEDRNPNLRIGNLMSTQVNLTPGHILHAGLLWNQWDAPRTGLTFLDPRETTIDRRSRQAFVHVNDQIYLGGHGLIEFGYAGNRTYGREIPQGWGILQYTPEGKRGYHFVDALRRGARDQAMINGFLPVLHAAGTHQLKMGLDVHRVRYWQDVERSAYENFDEGGAPLALTRFVGSGNLALTNIESAVFVQDSWRAKPSVLVEAGMRMDWDRLVRRWSPSPRLGVAWSPPFGEHTKLYAGVARVFDATSLRLFSRPEDQYALTSYFYPDGTVGRGPAVTLFQGPSSPLLRPFANTVNFGAEHHMHGSLAVRGDVLYRHGTRGFTYLNSINPADATVPEWIEMPQAKAIDALFVLTNSRVDTYRAVSFTVKQNFGRLYEWRANYTWSRALSNAVVDVNVDDPVSVLNNAGPMPWDVPHRFVGWGYLPLPLKNWAIATLLDTRTGFPFSTRTDLGTLTGRVNSLRYPAYFEWNLHFERRFLYRNNRWALRFGMNNVTDRTNPDAVNNNIGSSHYGQFYGGTGRSVNVRIRWLGKI
ncbi:MAG: TonB-dependent receptor [Acidobacteriota bacterium]